MKKVYLDIIFLIANLESNIDILVWIIAQLTGNTITTKIALGVFLFMMFIHMGFDQLCCNRSCKL